MVDLAENEALLRDFLSESGELLAEIDNALVELERDPGDRARLDAIFRHLHTIKGGAGFLGASELVALCHRTESLLDRLRSGAVPLDAAVVDVIMAATAAVRAMFDGLAHSRDPAPPPPSLIADLEATMRGPAVRAGSPSSGRHPTAGERRVEPDWAALYAVLTATARPVPAGAPEGPVGPAVSATCGRRETDRPDSRGERAGRRATDRAVVRDASIRVEATRLDRMLDLAREIGVATSSLNVLRGEILEGAIGPETLRALDVGLNRLDLLAEDLRRTVMHTRMQPARGLFQKYPRLARDLARQLGKQIRIEIVGDDTELDRALIEELSGPLAHLVRNAVDHGVESPRERRAAGKAEEGTVRLAARRATDRIEIEVSDDGRGMRADLLRQRAVEKGVVDVDTASRLDDGQALRLVLAPGFSTRDRVTSVSGRGVGLDVVRSQVQKLDGHIEIESAPGTGTTFRIALPVTGAVVQVLVVRVGVQPLALPLSLVRETVILRPCRPNTSPGRTTTVVRDEELPMWPLSGLLGWPQRGTPCYGVVIRSAPSPLVLGVDGVGSRDEVVVTPLEGMRPLGVTGAGSRADGSVVPVLDVEQLVASARADRG